MLTTVAIPARNGGEQLGRTLTAVMGQRITGELQVLVCDSGSSDGSVGLSRRLGAEVFEIDPAEFGHGRTRNLLMARSAGEHVAFLTQDAEPVDERWLERLLTGFAHAPAVGLVFGPYRPRPDASPLVSRELSEWFGRLAPDGRDRIDRLDAAERRLPNRALMGERTYFTDANGGVARAAWEEVPFQEVAYAEDHQLALDMMRAGWAKVFVPEAGVIHSHDYSTWDWLRRSFDEARAMREIYGWEEPLRPRQLALSLYGRVRADQRWAGAHAAAHGGLGPSLAHHAARLAGTVIGGRHRRLDPRLAARLSLEGRAHWARGPEA